MSPVPASRAPLNRSGNDRLNALVFDDPKMTATVFALLYEAAAQLAMERGTHYAIELDRVMDGVLTHRGNRAARSVLLGTPA